MTIARISSEFLVNTTTAGSTFDSSIAVLADGRIVVSWTDSSQTGGDTSGYAIRARIFNADGSQSVPELLVNTATLFDQYLSSVAMLADGRFVVSWTELSATGVETGSFAIRARIFNADGTESIPEFLVNTTTANYQVESSIAVLADGRFVVSWTDRSATGGDASGNAVRARIFNADGTQSVPEFLVNTTTASDQYDSSVAMLPDGRFVVSWRDDSQTGGDISSSAIRARIFNADGSQSVAEFLVNTATASSQFDSSIAVLTDGRFVISWTDSSQTGGDTDGTAIRARIFNADGTQSVPEFLVNTTTASLQLGSSIAVLADGRFVISWTDYSRLGGDNVSQDIRARIFNADGTQSVPEFIVNTTSALNQIESSIAALLDGRFVISWSDQSEAGGYSNATVIRSQIFDATVYDGTADAETVYGGSLSDRYNGNGGNDNISGRGGNDLLYGDDGDDSLYGGDGDDVLNGGDGGDSLYGGDGADQHIGGDDTGIDYARYDDANYGNLVIRLDAPSANTGVAAGDSYVGIEGVVGGVGNDVIVGNTSGNYLEGGAGDDIILAGDYSMPTAEDGADNVYGGAGNDLLWGYAGDDQLYGGDGDDVIVGNDFGSAVAGRDTIFGEAGNDTMFVGLGGSAYMDGGAGNDKFYGGSGDDTLRGGTGDDFLYGAAGADLFHFYRQDLAAGDQDAVYFVNAGDRLQFSASLNGALVFEDLTSLRYDEDPTHFTTGVYITAFLSGGATSTITVYGTTVAAILPSVDYTL